jgi:hypothetical protein
LSRRKRSRTLRIFSIPLRRKQRINICKKIGTRHVPVV